jgi:hypothetical protein
MGVVGVHVSILSCKFTPTIELVSHFFLFFRGIYKGSRVFEIGKSISILDTREEREFYGSTLYGETSSGYIPGSKWIYYKRFFVTGVLGPSSQKHCGFYVGMEYSQGKGISLGKVRLVPGFLIRNLVKGILA